jgi:hypothetical protein
MRLQLPWDTPVSLALLVWVCLLIIILVVCWLLCFGALPGLPSGIDWRAEEVREQEETGR